MAFDKHFNVVLANVTETFVATEFIPRVKKSELAEPGLEHLSKRQQTKLLRPRPVKTKKTRHIGQLFVRGSSVITVSASDMGAKAAPAGDQKKVA